MCNENYILNRLLYDFNKKHYQFNQSFNAYKLSIMSFFYLPIFGFLTFLTISINYLDHPSYLQGKSLSLISQEVSYATIFFPSFILFIFGFVFLLLSLLLIKKIKKIKLNLFVLNFFIPLIHFFLIDEIIDLFKNKPFFDFINEYIPVFIVEHFNFFIIFGFFIPLFFYFILLYFKNKKIVCKNEYVEYLKVFDFHIKNKDDLKLLYLNKDNPKYNILYYYYVLSKKEDMKLNIDQIIYNKYCENKNTLYND